MREVPETPEKISIKRRVEQALTDLEVYAYLCAGKMTERENPKRVCATCGHPDCNFKTSILAEVGACEDWSPPLKKKVD